MIPRPTLEKMEHESDGDRTATSYGTTLEATTRGELKVPDPPNAGKALSGEPFECPYCYSLIIVKNVIAWRCVIYLLLSITWIHGRCNFHNVDSNMRLIC